MPFWSPDSRSIGFFANGELKRIDLAEGFVRTLAPAPNPRNGTWNRDGTIVFGGVGMGPLHRVPAGGGSVTQVTDLLASQTSHRWPQFLPDGRRFLLMALGTPEVRGLYVGSLDDRTVPKGVGPGVSVLVRATGSPPGGARRRPARPEILSRFLARRRRGTGRRPEGHAPPLYNRLRRVPFVHDRPHRLPGLWSP